MAHYSHFFQEGKPLIENIYSLTSEQEEKAKETADQVLPDASVDLLKVAWFHKSQRMPVLLMTLW